MLGFAQGVVVEAGGEVLRGHWYQGLGQGGLCRTREKKAQGGQQTPIEVRVVQSDVPPLRAPRETQPIDGTTTLSSLSQGAK
jgi:hypothetical protein